MNNQERELPIAFLGQELEFPPLDKASEEGLLAIGGDLSVERLLLAYRSGIFPWFNDDTLILWWSPDPRMVLFPQKIRVSKSMQKIMSNGRFRLTKNTDFEAVIDHCASVGRKDHPGTWITSNMKKAYLELYRKGHVHSYEVWQEDKLVGGLYGVDLGHVFCGESMFSLVSNASKFALIRLADELAQKNYTMIDCQVPTPHLKSMGAEEISRKVFVDLLKRKV
ncbi:leucyl/phenylalanyl-tRNA--protein transferase [Allomuricauda sp. SCSIO 65647]|uniref:leucyl/phenylalanyl-tRNA--protein transferase n=1 Tax=Allomuricauda sp. SCSIO 65647 TaxID=2908843 RepID=UPI001F19E6E9|nr:leucyl/phenylalanyl-tRNA--protein transferase [Muricauda sp. SCSIO 65647]UJH66158.1 leucyl/phenylalanyl-tRNA--protein transferase [Muricauda sp. SCSIO 65647]